MREDERIFEVPFHLDERLAGPLTSLEPTAIDPGPLPSGTISERLTFLYSAIRDTLANRSRPLVISGDCMTAIATIAGLQQSNSELGVIWVDAHGDFNTPETTISGYVGGMPLATLVGRGDQSLMERLRITPLAERNVALVGTRDLDPAEQILLESSEVRRYSLEDFLVDDIPDRPIYLHVDVDVLDPVEMPGLRFPAPEGESIRDLSALLETIASVADIAGIGLACIWHPRSARASRGDAVCSDLVARLRH